MLDAAVAERDLEADVAHHGRDHGVALELPERLQVPSAHQQHRVAVDDAAPSRRRESRGRRRRRTRRPAGSRARPPREPAPRGWVEPQSRLMLRPSGVALRRCDVEPELVEQPRRHGRGRAVRGVDGEAGAGRAAADRAAPAARARCRRRSRRCGPPARPRIRRPPSSGPRRSPRPAAPSASVNFSPRPENTLMPLSWNGLCEAEITMPGVEAHLARDVGDRRRRE